MIEIKDTRKTATKDPRPKEGEVVRIDKSYFICVRHGHKEGKLLLNLCQLSDGNIWDDPRYADSENRYYFNKSEQDNYDIEVITNKITLTIE